MPKDRRFDCPAFLVPQKPARQSASAEPMRSRTQRAFLKPRSTAPSSVHATPDLLRSASGFRNTRSLHVSPILNASGSRIIARQSILTTISERSVERDSLRLSGN
jgi:hypothetical protein